MGRVWSVAVVALLLSSLQAATSSCPDGGAESSEVVCWIANWDKARCEPTTDHNRCKKLGQASYDDEYVCCNAMARTGRWNGSGPQGVCAHLKDGECIQSSSGKWQCTDERRGSNRCWYPDDDDQTCKERENKDFCTSSSRTVYKTPEYCCEMLSWGGTWNGRDSARGACKDICEKKRNGFQCLDKPSRDSSSSVNLATFKHGKCVCHRARKGETWATIAADYGTTPLTISEYNYVDVADNPTTNKFYKICPAPGPEDKRFRSGGRKQRFTGCLDDSYVRPCAGYKGRKQRNCFCSYLPDGSYQWPFVDEKDEACRTYIQCKGFKARDVKLCKEDEVVQQTESDMGTPRVTCVKKPKNFECSGTGCTEHTCTCRDLLLPTGTYHNPFDWEEGSGLKCDYNNTDGKMWYDGLARCSMGKYDPKSKECVSELTSKCEKRETYAGCKAFFPPDCDDDSRRKLQAPTLSWGRGSADRTCRWWNPGPCRCPATRKQTAANLGCHFNSCASKRVNACRNGGRFTKQPATRARDVCYCEFNGGCPYSFLRGCKWQW